MTAATCAHPHLRRNCRAPICAHGLFVCEQCSRALRFHSSTVRQHTEGHSAHETEEAAAEGNKALPRVRDQLAALLRRQLRGSVSVRHEEHDDAVCRAQHHGHCNWKPEVAARLQPFASECKMQQVSYTFAGAPDDERIEETAREIEDA